MVREPGREYIVPNPSKSLVDLLAEGKASVICLDFGHQVGFLSFSVVDFSSNSWKWNGRRTFKCNLFSRHINSGNDLRKERIGFLCLQIRDAKQDDGSVCIFALLSLCVSNILPQNLLNCLWCPLP